MSTYPIILNNLETQPVLILGGGKIAEDKLVSLLSAGAGNVTVISPELNEHLTELADAGDINWVKRSFSSGDITERLPFLLIAATDDPAVNHAAVEEARTVRVLAQAVDDIPFCDFYGVSVVRQGGLTIGIGTDGQMPALSARLRQKLSRGIGPEYARLIELARELRPLIAERFPDFSKRRQVWYALVDAPLIPMLRRGESDETVRAAMVRIVDEYGAN